MKKTFTKIISVALATLMLASCMIVLACCKDDPQTKYYDNKTDPLVFSTQELDKVFNPFFSTSATDSNVVGLTQISMLGNDKDGKYTYGDKESVVVKDLEINTVGEGENQTTTYKFVLKNNVRFSNGSYLTMKDVLFNLYVYLDPQYTGSATMYSTKIVGLEEYRTQATSEKEQQAFKTQFELEADKRMSALVYACKDILDDQDEALTTAELKTRLTAYSQNSVYENVLVDFNKADELFKEELATDYSNSVDAYTDMLFVDKAGKEYRGLFTTDVEVFLYNEGYVTWNKKEGKLESALTNNVADLKNWTKEQAIDIVYGAKMPMSVEEILMYWNTSVLLKEYLTNLAMEQYFVVHGNEIKNISGIKFANQSKSVTVNGKTYGVPVYADNEKNQVTEGNEVLSITIKGVDPKAIWNFAFAVAPMYYYSNEEQIALFDYNEHFGVEYASQSFMTNVVKNPDKIGVPVGAGPYAASKSSGGIANVGSGDFYANGMVYYEANPYYVMGEPLIKKVQYKVVASSQLLYSLYAGEVDFAEPNAKPETIAELDGKKSEGIANKSIQTAGYGYIGVNAGKVPSIYIRQAIMHAINTQECVDYYKTTADAIYRSMSMSNFAYPTGCTAYYPYIGSPIPEDLSVVSKTYREYVEDKGWTAGYTMTEAEQQEFLRYLIVDKAGYSDNGYGLFVQGSNQLKYTFTIAGEDRDHPAFAAMKHASEILNKVGFQITVTTDANALKKLATGDLTVWAAAWGSTIDPDMYQVYHKDSTATSTLNWGYKQIKANVGGKYDYEVALIDELSDIIDRARETLDQDERAILYSDALDIVMELAIELPTYQRDDLFAYNSNKIDTSTLTPDSQTSSYKGLTSELHLISLNVEK